MTEWERVQQQAAETRDEFALLERIRALSPERRARLLDYLARLEQGAP